MELVSLFHSSNSFETLVWDLKSYMMESCRMTKHYSCNVETKVYNMHITRLSPSLTQYTVINISHESTSFTCLDDIRKWYFVFFSLLNQRCISSPTNGFIKALIDCTILLLIHCMTVALAFASILKIVQPFVLHKSFSKCKLKGLRY